VIPWHVSSRNLVDPVAGTGEAVLELLYTSYLYLYLGIFLLYRYGALRGNLCDRTAFLLFITDCVVLARVAMHSSPSVRSSMSFKLRRVRVSSSSSS